MIRALALVFALSAVPALAAHPYDAACRITSSHASGFRAYGGSGVLIGTHGSDALVLTVQHVAIRPGRIATCQWGQHEATGYVVAVADGADVALLVVSPAPLIRPVPVALPTAESGPFVLAGYPGYDRDTLRIQSGAFVAADDSVLVVTCRPEKGMSGGPCFDRYGRVVGTVSAHNPLKYPVPKGYCGSGAVMLDLVSDYLRSSTPTNEASQ